MGAAENHLIELLPREARRRLLLICEPVYFELRAVLCEAGERTRNVYFPVADDAPACFSTGIRKGLAHRRRAVST